MHDNCTALIDELIALRKAKGWSQRQLAAACGYSQSIIARIETKNTSPTIATICIIAEALGATVKIEEFPGTELLPKHEVARSWVEELSCDGSINIAFYRAFSYLAEFDKTYLAKDHARPFVEYFFRLIVKTGRDLVLKEDEMDYLWNQWDSVVGELVGKDKSRAEKLLNRISKGNLSIVPELYLDIILQNWETVSSYHRTFRFLLQLARVMSDYLTDTPETRREYCRLVSKMSDQWP